MAGSTLLRDGICSDSGMWLKVMQTRDRGHWLMGFMRQVVVSCTCSVASSNTGSMRIHTPQMSAWAGVTWMI